MARRLERIVFEKVEYKRKVWLKCVRCEKLFQRTLTEWATINPFNTNEQGRSKTSTEVHADVRRKLDAAVVKALHDGIICRKCEESAERRCEESV